LVNIPASLVAHRLTGVALFPYIFDYFSYQWTTDFARAYAARIEAQVFERADDIITPNEFMVEQIRRRYSVKASIVRNPVEMSEYCRLDVQSETESRRDLKIVYTGSIYEAHFDAFRNLVKAISIVESPKFTLHIYSRAKARVLETQGIVGPVVLHENLPSGEVPEVQVSADVLFLPLAFESRYPEVINTSAPGKMGEYLASGRPILVHAPRDSFVAWYFKTYECGVVVDQPTPNAIQSALKKIHSDSSYASFIAVNALKRAQDDFSLAINRRRFESLLDISADVGKH
jgi:glycosyltransferase involved in cell wall biosynthesis